MVRLGSSICTRQPLPSIAAPKSRRSWPFPSITGGTCAAARLAPQHASATSASRTAPVRKRAADAEPVMRFARDQLLMTNLLHVVAQAHDCQRSHHLCVRGATSERIGPRLGSG